MNATNETGDTYFDKGTDELINQLLKDISPYVANCAYLVLNSSDVTEMGKK